MREEMQAGDIGDLTKQVIWCSCICVFFRLYFDFHLFCIFNAVVLHIMILASLLVFIMLRYWRFNEAGNLLFSDWRTEDLCLSLKHWQNFSDSTPTFQNSPQFVFLKRN